MDNRNGTDRRRLDGPLGVMIVSGLASFALAAFAYWIAKSDAVRLSRTQGGVVPADLTPAVVFAIVGVVLIVGPPVVLLVRAIAGRAS